MRVSVSLEQVPGSYRKVRSNNYVVCSFFQRVVDNSLFAVAWLVSSGVKADDQKGVLILFLGADRGDNDSGVSW